MKGFDSERYIDAQSAAVLKRISEFDKLYLEFGGKLTYDGHAARVLPGFKPTTKIDLLKNLGDLEIIYCINAKDLESEKRTSDFDLTWEDKAIKDIDEIKKHGLKVNFVCITRFTNEKKAKAFAKKIRTKGIKVYYHREIAGYPNDVDTIIKGYRTQSHIPTKSKLVIVTGIAGGSGKMATCMTQVYNEKLKGKKAGYSKYELFPIWNLPLNHPINIAYEAATADLGDYNMIDPYHLKAYKIKSINYNRDVENFAILKKLYELASGKKGKLKFKSPTDMGMNKAKVGIINDGACRKAAIKEIKRRGKVYKKEYKAGRETKQTVDTINKILNKVKA